MFNTFNIYLFLYINVDNIIYKFNLVYNYLILNNFFYNILNFKLNYGSILLL